MQGFNPALFSPVAMIQNGHFLEMLFEILSLASTVTIIFSVATKFGE